MTSTPRAITLDCFGTLVDADAPADPAAAVAAELRGRSIPVPDDWGERYRCPHGDPPDRGEERPLATHVRAALGEAGVAADDDAVAAATLAAFDRPADPRPGAETALSAPTVPVAVLSNCSVRGLVPRALARAGLIDDAAAPTAGPLAAVTTSVACGRRKPDPGAFAAAAETLGIAPADLHHVGDDPAADGGARAVGATATILDDGDPVTAGLPPEVTP